MQMYYTYKRTKTMTGFNYQFLEKFSLFGCNIGFIPNLLQCYLEENQNEPYFWHLNIDEHFGLLKEPAFVPIIDLKPKSSELALYEIVNIFGHSSGGWTPIMMHLRGLLVDENPKEYNRHEFDRNLEEISDPIFTFMYLQGSISNGKIVGRWTPPGASPTNSVLLWPTSFNYFIKKATNILDRMR